MALGTIANAQEALGRRIGHGVTATARNALSLGLSAMLLAACGGGEDSAAASHAGQRTRTTSVSPQRAALAVPAVASATPRTPRTPDADSLMDWAERTYPTLFPSHRPTLSSDPYVFRHYPETGHYIGIAGTEVYVLGPAVGGGPDPVYMGERSTFACRVYPVDCNTPPEARVAALPSGLLVGKAVELDGSTSHDADSPGALSYRWTLTTRPSGSQAELIQATQPRASLLPDRAGRYVVTLVVNDGLSDSPPLTVSFDVATPNRAPVAQIAPLSTINPAVGQALQFDGSKSSDPDGQSLRFSWTLSTAPSGSQSALSQAVTARPSLVPDRSGRYVVSLVVNDGAADSAPATLALDIAEPNQAPVAQVVSAERLFLGTDVQLDGSASNDPEGRPLQYLWTLTSRPAGSSALLADAGTARPRLVPDAAGSYTATLVVSDGQRASPPAAVTVIVVPVPASGLLIDARRDLASRAALESLLGGPLFTAWSPTQAGGSGMKIMMFGAADASCPAGVQGALGSFDDAVLPTIGYPGASLAVPADMRFEAKPGVCGAAAANKRGPSRVFSDGSSIWLSTATLGGIDDLLRPFTASGQNNTGSNVNVLNTSVNYKATAPMPPVKPWADGATARLAVSASVVQLQTTGGSTLNQAKQQMAMGLHNSGCSGQFPGRLCSIQFLFALAISQSDVSDWSSVGWAQGAYAFGDLVQGNMPIIDITLMPPSGQLGRHRESGVPFFTSRGSATLHAPFDRRSFAVDIDFEQFKAALRVASAQMFGEAVLQDAACSQCERLFGSDWANRNAWSLIELQSMQEIYDTTGRSGRVTGNYHWLYVGPAP